MNYLKIRSEINRVKSYFSLKKIGRPNMFKLSDKARIIFDIIGASSILISMYLIPFIKTENQFWKILLFIVGVLLIGISLRSPQKIKFWK